MFGGAGIDEVGDLMAGLLTSGEPPTGTTRLSNWLDSIRDGRRRYVSVLSATLPGVEGPVGAAVYGLGESLRLESYSMGGGNAAHAVLS